MKLGPRPLYFRVGLAILVGIGVIVGAALFVGSDRIGDSGLISETYFRESVAGLSVGSPVLYRGVTLGTVTDIRLVSAVYPVAQRGLLEGAAFQLVMVRFAIDPSLIGPPMGVDTSAAVEAGLRVRMVSQGITGVVNLELDFVDPSRYPLPVVPWEPQHPLVPSVPSTFSALSAAAERLAAELSGADLAAILVEATGLLRDMRTLLTAGEGYVALVETADLLRSLRGTSEVLGPELVQLVAEMRGVAAGLRAATGPELTRTVREAGQAAGAAREALAGLPAVLASADALIRRLDGLSAEADRDLAPLLRDARVAVSNLRAATETLRQYPGQVLFGGPPAPSPAGNDR